MTLLSGCRRSRGRLVWTKVDSTLLVLILVGLCILAITAIAVWYQYWITSDFYPGRCLVVNVTDAGPAQCPTSTDRCRVGEGSQDRPSTTMPSDPDPDDEPDSEQEQEVWNAKRRTHPSTPVSTPTTTMATKISIPSSPMVGDVMTTATTTPFNVTADTCGWFPCIRIMTLYYVTLADEPINGVSQLYPDYSQLISYPQVAKYKSIKGIICRLGAYTFRLLCNLYSFIKKNDNGPKPLNRP